MFSYEKWLAGASLVRSLLNPRRRDRFDFRFILDLLEGIMHFNAFHASRETSSAFYPIFAPTLTEAKVSPADLRSFASFSASASNFISLIKNFQKDQIFSKTEMKSPKREKLEYSKGAFLVFLWRSCFYSKVWLKLLWSAFMRQKSKSLDEDVSCDIQRLYQTCP